MIKKIFIYPNVSNVINPKGGPTICMKILQNSIIKVLESNEDFNFIKVVNNITNIKNSIIWHWTPIYSIDNIKKIIENNNIFICGPNSFFHGGEITDYEQYLIENKLFKYLFLHPNQYSENLYLKKFISDTTIFDITYPISQLCFNPINNIRTNDILIFHKFFCDDKCNELKINLSKYKIIYMKYGEYKFEDLIHNSLLSKCCIYLSYGETGGSACAEIMSSGCPIISYYGNLTYGDDGVNCFKLPDNGTFTYNFNLINELIIKCFQMDNLNISNYTRDKFNIDKITSKVFENLKNIYTLENN